MNVEKIRTADLIPYEKNTKKHDQTQVDNVAESIKQYGFVQPIVVDKDNVVVIGHCRLMAAKKLKMDEVPCVRVDELTDEQVRKLRIVDNKSNESPWDLDFLSDELADLDFSEFEFDFGLGDVEVEETEIVEDEAPEVDEEHEPTAKFGDIWQLGRHRLMCGDSTDRGSVEQLTNGAKADLVFTDPPYGMKKEADGVKNDNLNYDDLLEFNKQWIPLSFDALKDNGSWYCWGIDEPLMDIYSHIIKPMTKKHGEDKTTLKNYITWDKGVGFGQMSNLQRSYTIATEKCLFVMRGRQDYGETKEDYWDGFEPLRKKFDEERKKTWLPTEELCKLAGATSITHWWSVSQWEFPNKERYEALQKALRGGGYDGFRAEYDKIRAEYDKIRAEYDKIRAEWYKTRAYFDNTHDNMNDVWHFNVTSQKERELAGGHATPKPIALCGRAIKSSSREGEIVLDVFGGSGSTLIACEQLNRTCYMMELVPKYVDVIIKRWETLTGGKAVKIS